MKEIYVIKKYIGGYTAITEFEIQQMIAEGVTLVNVDLTSDDVKIHLYEERLFAIFGIPEDAGKKLVEDYFKYISSITGCDIPEFEI